MSCSDDDDDDDVFVDVVSDSSDRESGDAVSSLNNNKKNVIALDDVVENMGVCIEDEGVLLQSPTQCDVNDEQMMTPHNQGFNASVMKSSVCVSEDDVGVDDRKKQIHSSLIIIKESVSPMDVEQKRIMLEHSGEDEGFSDINVNVFDSTDTFESNRVCSLLSAQHTDNNSVEDVQQQRQHSNSLVIDLDEIDAVIDSPSETDLEFSLAASKVLPLNELMSPTSRSISPTRIAEEVESARRSIVHSDSAVNATRISRRLPIRCASSSRCDDAVSYTLKQNLTHDNHGVVDADAHQREKRSLSAALTECNVNENHSRNQGNVLSSQCKHQWSNAARLLHALKTNDSGAHDQDTVRQLKELLGLHHTLGASENELKMTEAAVLLEVDFLSKKQKCIEAALMHGKCKGELNECSQSICTDIECELVSNDNA